MPLNGSGGVLGGALASAVGAGPSAGGMFQIIGETIAKWAPGNIVVNSMTGTPPMSSVASAGVGLAGFGRFEVSGTKEDLGALLCAAMGMPKVVPKWIAVAGALIEHFKQYGLANSVGLTVGLPFVLGQGTLQWLSPVFVPPLAAQLEVVEPVAAGLLLAFETALLAHLQTNSAIVGASLGGPPITAPGPPTGGLAVGTGTIT